MLSTEEVLGKAGTVVQASMLSSAESLKLEACP